MKIRWKNSYKMLEKAWELKKTIWKWIKSESNDQFQNLLIQNNKWKKVINIFKIFKLFYILTILIDTILQVSIHSVFHLFNWLFDRIEDLEKKLKKNEQEKTELFQILAVAKKKFMIYYRKTSDVYDHFFNFAIILNSSIKLNLYKMSFFMNLSQ